jgi:N-acyl-D-amino-acid deacylase
MLLKAPLLLAHDNDYGWWENEEKLRMARAQGYNVWGEYYPYVEGSTGVSADFLQPKIWLDKYHYEYKDTLYDPTTDSFIPDRETYEKIVKEEPGRIVVVVMPYRKPWVDKWLRIPHMTVASDSMIGIGADGKFLPWDADYSKYAGNPRTPGAMAKTLRLGREQGVPLMFTLAQLSYWSALHLGDTGLQDMKDRGRVQVGKIADLTLIDPEKVTDRSTMKRGEQGLPSTGLPYVIVNGTIVVKNNEVLRVKPGKPIRFPVEAKGRFKPASVTEWLATYTIPVETMHLDDTGLGAAVGEKK